METSLVLAVIALVLAALGAIAATVSLILSVRSRNRPAPHLEALDSPMATPHLSGSDTPPDIDRQSWNWYSFV